MFSFCDDLTDMTGRRGAAGRRSLRWRRGKERERSTAQNRRRRTGRSRNGQPAGTAGRSAFRRRRFDAECGGRYRGRNEVGKRLRNDRFIELVLLQYRYGVIVRRVAAAVVDRSHDIDRHRRGGACMGSETNRSRQGRRAGKGGKAPAPGRTDRPDPFRSAPAGRPARHA